MIRSIRVQAVAALLALTVTACGGADLTPPTSPTPAPQTEIFSGQINQHGAATYPFTALAGGTVTVTLKSVSPEVVIGLSLGTWNGLACQIVIANDAAVQTTVVAGTVATVGNLCVRVYDVGKVTEPTAYEIQVVHP